MSEIHIYTSKKAHDQAMRRSRDQNPEQQAYLQRMLKEKAAIEAKGASATIAEAARLKSIEYYLRRIGRDQVPRSLAAMRRSGTKVRIKEGEYSGQTGLTTGGPPVGYDYTWVKLDNGETELFRYGKLEVADQQSETIQKRNAEGRELPGGGYRGVAYNRRGEKVSVTVPPRDQTQTQGFYTEGAANTFLRQKRDDGYEGEIIGYGPDPRWLTKNPTHPTDKVWVRWG